MVHIWLQLKQDDLLITTASESRSFIFKHNVYQLV